MKKKIVIVISILLIGVLSFWFIKGRMGVESANTNAVTVNVMEAVPGNITTVVSADGNIRAAEIKEIKSRINSFVEEVYVESGDMINKNNKIIKMEDYELKDKFEEGLLNLKEAEINYDDLYQRYKIQDKLNNLKIEEAEKNLEIAISSKEKEEINLNKQREALLENLEESKDSLVKAKSELEDKEYLYTKGAITKNSLEQSQDNYETHKDKYNNLKKDLKILEEKTIPNSLRLADLKVANARNNLDLLKYNIENEKIGKKDLELAETKVKRIESNLNKIKKDLDNVLVKSPYKGTIIDTKFSEGSIIKQGSVIATLADIKDIIAEVFVDEIDINQIEKGQDVVISSDSFSKKINGKVDYIAPVSTKVGNINKYKTEIKLNNPEQFLKVGMFLNAEIVTNNKNEVIVLPSMAILGAEEKYVFVNENNKAIKKPVKIGLQSISSVEVMGIKEGEKVIIGPFNVLRNLQDGTEIVVLDN